MATRLAKSPSSSPRLPSPPPMAEDQTAPVSPRPGSSKDAGSAPDQNPFDLSASRRIRPGTKAAEIAEGPPLVELAEIESAFQLTEHIKALHHSYTHPATSDSIHPLSAEQASILSQPPPGVDRPIWLYELCRFLIMKTNTVITHLFAESPPCSAQTCPEMRASEWQYLCAVHNQPKPCCAIDYCCHTLDWAANSVTSPKDFASRLSLSGEDGALAQQVKTITNIMRRVYRIFAHAWFSHREMFWKIENKEGLYVFFKTVCDTYSLIPELSYTIPPEAAGKDPADSTASEHQASPPSILRRSDARPSETEDAQTNAGPTNLPPGATARRHRHTPSTGAAVEPVLEEAEEDDDLQPSILQTPANTPVSPPPTTALPLRPPPRQDTQIHLNTTSSYPIALSTSSAQLSSHPAPQLSTSPPASPPTAFPPSPTETTASSATAEEEDDDDDDDIIESPIPSNEEFDATPEEQARIIPASSRPFSPFSPASPKAATVEEMAKEREDASVASAASESIALPGESGAIAVPVPEDTVGAADAGADEEAKVEETAKEGEVAGDTVAGGEGDAVKSVED